MVQRSFLVGSAFGFSLLHGICAQSLDDFFTFSTDSYPTITRDSGRLESSSVPLATPTATGHPCGRISQVVETWSSSVNVSVSAELAYDCLTSVPVDRDTALRTIDAFEKMAQFQSNLAYLKNPPEGYDNPPVDILGGLADIRSQASRNEYPNQFEFEAAIAGLLNSARDGHLGFDGPTFIGAVRWRRDTDTTLVSTSLDGGPPKVYTLGDVNHTSSPSPVSRIDGEDVQVFLQKEADRLTYHDADARWNAMFFRQAAQSYGNFITPRWYPGPTTTVAFDNGTENTYLNRAILRDQDSWLLVSDGDSFYSNFVASTPSRRIRRQITSETALRVPKRLQHVHASSDTGNGDIPRGFPEPYITGPSEVYVNGYFIDHPNITDLAVLSLQTFDTKSNEDALLFQSLIERFLSEAKSRGSEKVIVDLQSNGGGRVFLGYDAFFQFFPTIEPFGGSRYRQHEAANILGTAFSSLTSSQSGYGLTSPFNFRNFISGDDEAFTSWTDMYQGPSMNGDNFTNLLRYNFSDPNLSEYGEGLALTGYGQRSNFTDPPFAAQDIILLTDGVCGSTCSLFVESMAVEAGVKILVLGGRPEEGPMQPIGATQGVNVLDADYLITVSETVLSEFASTTSEQLAWASVLPEPFPIHVYEASVNFLDNIRAGDETMTPTQFTEEAANCRLWDTARTATDIIELWTMVADVAWGGPDGGIDESRCVPGSYRAQSMLEDPPGSAASTDPSGGNGPGRRGEGIGNTGAVTAFDVRWALPVLLTALFSVVGLW